MPDVPGRPLPDCCGRAPKRPTAKHPPPDGARGPEEPFRVPEGTLLPVIGVRECVLLCDHAWHPLLVHPDLAVADSSQPRS